MSNSSQVPTSHFSKTSKGNTFNNWNEPFERNVKLSLKTNYYPHSSRLQATLDITNTPSESSFAPSQIKLGQKNVFQSGSVSYYDKNKIPKEIWKVEEIYGQVESYIRFHEKWIAGKSKWYSNLELSNDNEILKQNYFSQSSTSLENSNEFTPIKEVNNDKKQSVSNQDHFEQKSINKSDKNESSSPSYGFFSLFGWRKGNEDSTQNDVNSQPISENVNQSNNLFSTSTSESSSQSNKDRPMITPLSPQSSKYTQIRSSRKLSFHGSPIPSKSNLSSGSILGRWKSKLTTITLDDGKTILNSKIQDNIQNIARCGSMSSNSNQSNVITLFQSPICQLFGYSDNKNEKDQNNKDQGEVILQHEVASFLFSVNIPQNIPPEYKSGSLIKFRYILRLKLKIHNSFYGTKFVELEAPFKVSNAGASLARVSCNQIISGQISIPDDTYHWTVYYDHSSILDGRRWFLDSVHPQLFFDSMDHYSQKFSTFESIRRYVNQKHSKSNFNVLFKSNDNTLPDRLVCTLTLPNLTYQIGDRIYMLFDFTQRQVFCESITCKLICSEKVHELYHKDTTLVLDSTLTDHTIASFTQIVSHLDNYSQYFVIPEETQPQFKTDIMDLSIYLSYEFKLEGDNYLKWNLPIEIFNITPEYEQYIANVSETSKVITY